MNLKKISDKFQLLIFFISALFVMSSAAWAANYYVDRNHPNAKDSNSGKEDSPWLTIQRASNSIAAGDIVYIKAGVYNESVSIGNSGTSAQWITFQAYGDDSVTLRGKGSEIGMNIWDKSYIKVQGLKFDNYSKPVYIGGSSSHHITIKGCEIKNSFYGVMVSPSVTGNIEVVENSIHDCKEYGIIFNNPDCKNNLIKSNHIYNIQGGASSNVQGIYAKFSDSTIEGNTIHHCGTHKYYDHGIYLSYSDRITVARNNIYSNRAAGIKVTNSNYIDIYYNLVHSNKVGLLLTALNDLNVLNNVIYDNSNADIYDYRHGIYVTSSDCDNIVIENNIVAENGEYGNGSTNLKVVAGVTNFSSDYNCIYYSGGGHVITYAGTAYTLSGFNKATGNEAYGIAEDPKFRGPNVDNFTLESNSPCIDAGVNVGLIQDYNYNPVPQGPVPDISAFEYQDKYISPPSNVRVTSP